MRRLPEPMRKTMNWLVTSAPAGNRFFLRAYDSILWRIDGPIRGRTYFGATMACDPRDFIQAMILHFGVWEPTVSAVFESVLFEGDVAIDIGANAGYDTLLAAYLVGPSGKVIAVEASPSIFSTLRRNVEMNPGLSIECLNVAASDRNETVRLFRGPSSNSGKTTTSPERGFDYECDIQAKPITAIVDAGLLARVRLIKVDIEGGEIPVMRDLLDSIDLFPESIAIVVEISPTHEWADIFDRFHSLGFRSYTLHNSYDREYYLSHNDAVVRPELIMTPPVEQTDVLFTKTPFERATWPPRSKWRRWRELVL